MRPHRVIMAAPALDHDLSLSERIEYLTVQQLVAKSGVEALDIISANAKRSCERRRGNGSKREFLASSFPIFATIYLI